VSGNDSCADCSGKDPEWVSLNLGILVCVNCSGIHRSLGVHISKVRSVQMDKLDKYAMETLKIIGNDRAYGIWESKLKGSAKKSHKPNKTSKNWIKNKYEKRSFVAPPEKDVQDVLFTAIESKNPVDVLKAIAMGANLNKPDVKQENRTSVHQAVMYGDYKSLDIMLQNGGDATVKESRGWTPLHYAAYQDDVNLCELLLLRGGSILATAQSLDGQNPLETARSYAEKGEPKCAAVIAKALQTQLDKNKEKQSKELTGTTPSGVLNGTGTGPSGHFLPTDHPPPPPPPPLPPPRDSRDSGSSSSSSSS